MRIVLLVACPWAAMSPLHAKIVFVSLRAGNFEIYKMDANGRNKTRLTRNEVDEYAPIWSPDGGQIAFESYRDGNGEIYVMDADGGNQRNLTQHPAADGSPDWASDGTRIAFHRARDLDANIYTIDTDGKNLKQITRLEWSINPKWSPDSRWIAFDWWANPPGIYAIEPDTTLLCRISKPGPNVPMFVVGWSSDGSKVMYAAPIAKTHNDLVLVIATLSPDGHGEVVKWEEVPLPQRLDSTPAWETDGRSILFTHEAFGNEDIYRYRLDNQKLIQLTDHPAKDSSPHEWNPRLLVLPQGLVPKRWGEIKSNAHRHRGIGVYPIPPIP